MSRRWIAACGACVLIGAVLGRTFPLPATPVPSAEPAAPCTPENAPAPPRPRPATAPPTPGCEAVAAQLAEERALRQGLELELYGEPIPWPDEAAPQRADAELTEVVGAVIHDCAPGWQHAAMECREPPCIAAIWMEGGGSEGVGSCPPWVERYGIAASQATQTVTCPDGTQRRLMLLSPTDVAYANADAMMADLDRLDPAERENRSKRLQHRWDLLRQDLPCPR